MEIKYRPVKKEDAYAWYTLLDEVWRDAYAHILPREVFDGRDFLHFGHISKSIKGKHHE